MIVDLPRSLNLLFNFSKQASTVVASNFCESEKLLHFSNFLQHSVC